MIAQELAARHAAAAALAAPPPRPPSLDDAPLQPAGRACAADTEAAPQCALVGSLALLSGTSRRTLYDQLPHLAAVPNGLRVLAARTKEDRARADHGLHFTKVMPATRVSDCADF
jgi:hypothetical protein